jgi:general secretion pathway protein H
MHRRRSSQGFTLLEIMIVILLIGLMASAVMLNYVGQSRADVVEKELDRLDQMMQVAAEVALTRQLEIGVHLDDKGYRFMLFEQNRWLTITAPRGLAPYAWPEGLSLELELEGLPWAKESMLAELSLIDEEQESLFEGNSFDDMAQEKAKAEAAKADAERAEALARGEKPSGGATSLPSMKTGLTTELPVGTDPKVPQVLLLSSGEVTPFRLTLQDRQEQPYWRQQLSAEFTMPLLRGELDDGR